MRLMIVDNDGDFRRRFSGYIASGCSNVSITACDEGDGVGLLAQPYDLILCDDGVSPRFRQALLASEKNCRWLSRSQEESAGGRDSCTGIYKYQSAGGILRSIPELWEKSVMTGLFADSGERHTLIAVSGFSGGCGRTAFAVALGRLVRQKTGQGVLILSMKPVSDLYDYFPADSRPSADINLLLLNYASGTSVNSGAFVITDSYGVSVIRPPSQQGSDLPFLSAAELQGFLSYIREWNCFQTVILDMEELLNEAHCSVYEKADHIFLLHDDRRFRSGAEEAWVAKVCAAAGKTPVRRILNFDPGGDFEERIFFDEESLNQDKPWDFVLPVDPDSFYAQEGRIEISLSGAFCAGVSTICKGMMREWK